MCKPRGLLLFSYRNRALLVLSLVPCLFWFSVSSRWFSVPFEEPGGLSLFPVLPLEDLVLVF